jgi:hypothetical protein
VEGPAVQARKFETKLTGVRARLALAFTMAMLLALLVPATALATTVFVTTSGDVVDGDTSSLTALSLSPGDDGSVSLREAVLALDGETLPATIMLDSLTYELERDTSLVSSGGHAAVFGGPLVVSKSVQIVGSSATIAPRTPVIGNARIFDIDPLLMGGVSFSLSDATLANGVAADGWGGGALIAGGGPFAPKDSVTLSGCTVVNNSTAGAFPASGGALNIGENADLSLTNCMFASNLARGVGGAIFVSDSGTGSVAISGCSFTSNAAQGGADSAGQGGAIYATAGTGGGTITGSTFTGNAVASDGSHGPDSGGALFLGTNGTITMSGNRIAGNVADACAGLYGSMGTINAQKNWWGRNAAPTSAPALVGGTGVDASHPMQLTLTPTPSFVHTDDTGQLTAHVAYGATTPPDDGTVVSFGGGSLGSMDTPDVILAGGVADDTFYAGSDCGPNVVSATYDSQVVTAAVGVTREPELSGLDSAEFTVGSYGQADITSYGYLLPGFSLVGALPSGLSFAATSPIDATHAVGRFWGTPGTGTGGVYHVTVSSSNAIAPDATHDVDITVNEAPEITSCPDEWTVTDGVPTTLTVSASGYPVPDIIAWGLPSGLTVTDNHNGTATIHGTPHGEGEYDAGVEADNLVGSPPTQDVTIHVQHAAHGLSVDSLRFTVGEFDWAGIVAYGYPVPNIWVTGTLPSGLALVDDGGWDTEADYEISGEPDSGTGGLYPITVHAQTGVGPAISQNATIEVDEAPSFTSAGVWTVTKGVPATFTVETTGYPTADISASGLPAGLTLTDNGDGTAIISGTPTGTGGIYEPMLDADNHETEHTEQGIIINVQYPATNLFLGDPTFSVGIYTQDALYAEGLPVPDISVEGTLPDGLSWWPTGMVTDTLGSSAIGGTPAAGTGGLYPLVVRASNGIGAETTSAVTLTVLEVPSIGSPGEATLTASQIASIEVTTSGYPEPTLSVEGELPGGLTFTDNGDGTGAFSGTLGRHAEGEYTATIHADNWYGGDRTRTITFHVVRTPAEWESRTFMWDTQADFEHNASTIGATTTIAGDASCTSRVPGSVAASSISSIAAGEAHTVALRSNGTVSAVGYNPYGQCNVGGWTGVTAVAAGDYHTVGLKSDGTVVATGYNGSGECNVGAWTDITAIAAGDAHTVGLKSDGTVVATGSNGSGQCNVSGWTGIIAVAAGNANTLALKSDGTVVATGYNGYGQCNVSGWTSIKSIAAGHDHTVGLKSDGTVVATGLNSSNQCSVSGWTGITAISAGNAYTVGLRSNGTAVATGYNGYGQCNVGGWGGITSIAAGGYHAVGLKSDGTVATAGSDSAGQCDVASLRPVAAIGGSGPDVGLRAIADSGFSGWDSLVASIAPLPNGGAVKFAVRLSGDGVVWSPPLGRDGNAIDWTTGSGNYLGAAYGEAARTDLSALPKSRYIDLVVRAEGGGSDVELKGVSVSYDRDDAVAPIATDDAPSGWRNADTGVTIAATDAVSGVAAVDVAVSPNAPVTSVDTDTVLVGVSAEGTTTIQYSATDDAGNRCATQTATVRIDKSAPALVVSASLASVSLEASDAVSGIAGVWYSIDGGATQLYVGGSFSPGASGTHLISAWATDVAGHVSVKSAIVSVDTQAPTASDDAPVSWQSADTTVTLAARDAEGAVGGIDWVLGGASAPATGSSAGGSAGVRIAAEGTTTIEYSATDIAGNRCATQTAIVRIDKTAPVSAATYGTGWQHGPVTVMLSAGDALSGATSTWYRTNPAAAWTLYTGPFQVAEEGASSVQYRAYDLAGNAEDPQTALVQIDNTPPSCADDAPAGWINHAWQLQWSSTDALSGVAAMDADYSGAYVWNNLYVTSSAASNFINQEGTTTLVFTSTDAVGNTSTPHTATLRIDRTAPTTTASHTAGWANAPVAVTLDAADAYSGVAATYYRIGSSGRMLYDGPFEVAASGDTTVTFWSVDVAGNTEDAQTTVVGVDETAPAVSDDAPSSWQHAATNVHLSATDSASGVSAIDYALTGPDGVTTTATVNAAHATVPVSAEGTTTLAYSAIDSAGNRCATQAATVRIDTGLPTIALHDVSVSSYLAKLHLSATDVLTAVTLCWRIGDEPTQTLPAAETTITYPVSGVHTITAWSLDEAGNGSAPLTYEFTVMGPAQIDMRTGSAVLPAYGAAFTLAGDLTSGGDPIAGARVAVQSSADGVDFRDCSLPVTTSPTGAFTLSVVPAIKTVYRVRSFAATGLAGVFGPAVWAQPRALVSNPSAPSKMKRGRGYWVSGTLGPRHAVGGGSVRVYLWHWEKGRWKGYGYKYAALSGTGSYSRYRAAVRPSKRGTWRMRAYHADTGHAESWSAKYAYAKVR